MKPSKIFVFHALLFLLAVSVFPQNTPEPGRPDVERIVRAERVNLIKSDILKDIKLFGKKDQAFYYLSLADALSKGDQQKESAMFFQKGIEIGLDPAIKFKDDDEKLTHFWNLLDNVSGKDTDMENKIFSIIKAIKIDRSKPEVSEDTNKTYLLIAGYLLNRRNDQQAAFDFAMLSLRGSKPVVNWYASRFYWNLKDKNEALANSYFTKALESVKANKDYKLIAQFETYLINGVSFATRTKDKRFVIADAQKKEFLESMLPFIQSDIDKLTLKKAENCGTIFTGIRFLKDYRRLLPDRAQFVEKSINICQNSDIKFWKKPDFRGKSNQPTQDLLNTAKEIGDRKSQIDYIFLAAHSAERGKNYQLAIDILDGIESESRNSNWYHSRISFAEKLVVEYFDKEDFAAAAKFLDNQPQELRPYIIIRALSSRTSFSYIRPSRKEFALKLLNQARTDFDKIVKSPLEPADYLYNPTQFGQITVNYVQLKSYDEAITVHTESIKKLNGYVNDLPQKYKENGSVPQRSSYSNFSNITPANDLEFVNKYFDKIYANIAAIENNPIRISERIGFLRKNLIQPKPIDYSIPGIPNEIPRYKEPSETN